MSAFVKSLALSVLFALCASTLSATPWTVAASLDYYAPQGTPNIGDIGKTENRRINRTSPVIAIDYAVKEWLSLELSYRYTPTFTAEKVSGGANLFPLKPGTGSASVLTPYDLTQKIQTLSIGPTCSFALGHRFRLSVGAFAAFEDVASEIDLVFGVSRGITIRGKSPTMQGVSDGSSVQITSGKEFYLSSHERSIRPSGRVCIGYAVTVSTSIEASWTLIDSRSTAASYFGLGLARHF